MNLYEFILKYYHRPVDYDGHFGNQCVDLYRQYAKDVLEFPQSPGVVGAKDMWTNYLETHYTRIANGPDNYPEPGDVVIWSGGYGPFGHVAICVLADAHRFVSFDQNLPIGSLPHLQLHDYVHVLGWLRPHIES